MSSEPGVFAFGFGDADGHASMRDLLGGKGANLAELSRLGAPVPPGMTLCTDAERVRREDVEAALARIERGLGLRFGDPERPLLLSVRSGARVSMPGMMETVLDIGLNDQTVLGLGESRFAWDAYRRLVSMYGAVVLGLDAEDFERPLASARREERVERDAELSAAALRRVTEASLALCGDAFPQDPRAQLWGAVDAVYASWWGDRAVAYRRLEDIPDAWGTAVTIQAMVYGNRGDDSGSGVAFTRDPATGAPGLYGEFLPNAQGEDVVAGVRTPMKVEPEMARLFPEAAADLERWAHTIEAHFGDMQDLEFTIDRGRLWILQTRTGKRTAQAALRVATDLVGEGQIDRGEALMRVPARRLEELLHPRFTATDRPVIAHGLPASPGAGVGRVVTDADSAVRLASQGEAVVLVRRDTSADDIRGLAASRGALTARGGQTSHAAVVARGMGRPCVVGCEALRIEGDACIFESGGERCVVRAGEYLSIDGATGEVMRGRQPTAPGEPGVAFQTLLRWADEVRRLGVRANADTPADATLARSLGAAGVGLCRTEHMFFEPEALPIVRRVVGAEDDAERDAALAALHPLQRRDFEGILRAMAPLPVVVRLLDPPLHEFLPASSERQETNPMLGHRGCRLGISHPAIYDSQVRALMEAAVAVGRDGVEPRVGIMVPFVAFSSEFGFLRKRIEGICAEVAPGLAYEIGTMIELPAAALGARDLAAHADFFSFGTNDLTQTTLGFSRDDATEVLAAYERLGLLERDPFVGLHPRVRQLVRMATEGGRSVRGDLEVGLCGEQGGDPASVAFCDAIGLDYVSVSPYRVPAARLAAAQAALKRGAPP